LPPRWNTTATLRIALARVDEARAQAGLARADRLPQVDALAQRAASLTPADLSATNRQLNSQRYDVNLGVSAFELDFWGRVKSLDEAARAAFLASDYAQQSLPPGLIGDVASAYLSLHRTQERRALAAATLASRGESRRLIAARRDVGLAGDLDVLAGRRRLQTARAEVANLARSPPPQKTPCACWSAAVPAARGRHAGTEQGLVADSPVGLPRGSAAAPRRARPPSSA
jgi:multidrug efflux system outer membrane protein